MGAKTKTPEAPLEEVAVYDGRVHLGDLVEVVCGFDACLADGRDVGRFPSRSAAQAALIAAAKAR